MKLGFNAVSLSHKSFDEVLDFASVNGFSSVEVVCSPKGSEGIHHIDVEDIDNGNAKVLCDKLQEKNVSISSLSYYTNIFSGNAGEKNSHTNYLKMMVDAASKLGVENVSTFTGFMPGHAIVENLEVLESIIKPVLSFAKERNVRILLENAPLVTGRDFAANFAYSPEIWDIIFTRIPDDNFGLNYDPSHLFWLGADYVLFLSVFAERLFHVQAKDAEILLERLRMTGILGTDWFRYRIPGSGSLDWKRFLSSLYESGYDGVLSIENEDPVWLDTPSKVERGILLGKNYLQPYIC
ncbi:MAG: sugar phosphate isomerase/epimerase [Firmicutes bacterium]|nr:sugar phosphate isomerase/epimerase [Bacillota bacterium]